MLNKSKKDPELYYYFNTKGDKRWMFRHKYYDEFGIRQEKKQQGFHTEKEAHKVLLKIKVETLRGATKQVQFSNYTVAQWFDTWYKTYKKSWKVTTRTQRESAIRLHIKPLLGHYKLANLDRITYQNKFINRLLEEKQSSTVETLHNIFKIGINSAVEEEIIPKNRFNKLRIRNEEEENFVANSGLEENYLEAHEVVKLLNKAKEIINITGFSLLLLLVYTGLRRGEAHGLRWNNIDMDNRKLTVERTRDHKGVRPPKTKNSYRTIDLDEPAIDQLKKYKTWCKKILLSFGRHLKEDDYIFISYQTGKPLSDNTINNALDRVTKRTGIKRITPHGLRHTHATILLNDKENRLNIEDVAERLGDTPQEIQNTYKHVLPERKKETAHLFTEILVSAETK
uniref:Site-specific integrase n=1 Tax=Virgibacillus oceani TaxID=1479511 RepID=A0A917HNH8_9BACI|nr:site-specific integrase [Virgibacillus oceani]